MAQDADSKLTFGYDSAGRLIRATTGDAATPALAQVPTPITYSYDPVGNRTSLSCPRCAPSGSTYDGLNRPLNIVHPNFMSKSFEYDALSRLTRITGGGGISNRFTYDDASQLVSIRHLMSGIEKAPLDYTYDRLGNRLSLTDRLGLHQYTYDTLSRLTQADHPLLSPPHPLAGRLPDEAFTYDAVGNRLTSHLSASHLHDAANRLLEDDRFTYTYDANGNRTSKTEKATSQVTTYTYDIENQLVTVHSPLVTASYRYDSLGRRIEKDVAGSITRYLYDQEDIIAIFRGPTNCQTHVILHGPGIDQPLAMLKDTNNNCNPFFDAVGFREPIVDLLADGLGSLVALTSETGGFFPSLFLAERTTYDSFGTPTILGPGPDHLMDTADDVVLPQSAFGNIYFFAGREFDFESGLYYNRYRYWDPHTGRFLQEDPRAGFLQAPSTQQPYSYAGSVGKPLPYFKPVNETNSYLYTGSVGKPLLETNLYLYTGNNPINRTDPFGLYWGEDRVDWWMSESVVPGPYGQPRSEWGSAGPTSWGDPLQYTEAAGGAWMWTERAAVGTAAAATAVAVCAPAAQQAVRQGGWLNSNPYLRIGWGRHQGQVFRIAGEWLKRLTGREHIDLWRGGP